MKETMEKAVRRKMNEKEIKRKEKKEKKNPTKSTLVLAFSTTE